MRFGSVQTSAWILVFFFAFLIGAPLLRPASGQESSPAPQSEAASDAILAPKDPDEDLNSLRADPARFHVQPPFTGATLKTATFTRELVRVQWRFADPIDLWVIRPAGVTKPPVILYLYSYPSETDRFRDDGYCERVTRNGFAAVGFVSALTGHRYHGVPMKEWFVSDLPRVLVESAHDVQMILDYLATRGDVDMDRVGMYGQGSGGTIAVLAASVDPRIKALNLLSPWGDWKDWMRKSIRVPEAERPAYVKREFLKRAAAYDTVRWLPKLKSRSVRVQNIADDGVTPAICQKKIERAARRVSARIDRYKDVEEMLVASTDGKAFQWIKDQFKSVPEQQVASR